MNQTKEPSLCNNYPPAVNISFYFYINEQWTGITLKTDIKSRPKTLYGLGHILPKWTSRDTLIKTLNCSCTRVSSRYTPEWHLARCQNFIFPTLSSQTITNILPNYILKLQIIRCNHKVMFKQIMDYVYNQVPLFFCSNRRTTFKRFWKSHVFCSPWKILG